MKTKSQFHWFWAWEDEKEEAWLREQARQGWHFRAVSFPSNYLFEQGPPADVVYRLDYINSRRERGEYLQLFADAGWEHLGEMGGWQYFRHAAEEGALPEIYTDNASKAEKYQRVMMILVILLPILFNGVILINVGAGGALMQIAAAFLGALLLLYVYAMFRLWRRILQLRRSAA